MKHSRVLSLSVGGCLVVVLVFGARNNWAQRATDQVGNPVAAKYGMSLQALYPDLTDGEIDQLLRETWMRELTTDPKGRVKEAPFRGQFVTVSGQGFREVPNQGPWPPTPSDYYTIFMFGGSSAFNYGVPDDQTIAAHLQELLDGIDPHRPTRLYNFGVAFYTSTQERELFDALVADGFVPDLAIFLDGMNDFCYTRGQPPQAVNVPDAAVAAPQVTWRAHLAERVRSSPLGKLARTVGKRLLALQVTPTLEVPTRPTEPPLTSPVESAAIPATVATIEVDAGEAPAQLEVPGDVQQDLSSVESADMRATVEADAGEAPSEASAQLEAPGNVRQSVVDALVGTYYDNTTLLTRVIQRYMLNKLATEDIGTRIGANTLFVWQPVPNYQYDIRLHPFAAEGFGSHTYAMFGYPLMASFSVQHDLGHNFVWCADLQREATTPLYVDKIHYSARLSRMIAECIADGAQRMLRQDDAAMTARF